MSTYVPKKKLDLGVFGAETAPIPRTVVHNPTIVIGNAGPALKLGRIPLIEEAIKGRSKLTPERSERIVNLIRSGATHTAAAGANGIDYTTFCRWISQGKRDLSNGENSIHAMFAVEVFIAEYELENDLSLKWSKIVSEPTVKRVYKGEPVRDDDGNLVVDENGLARVVRVLESETETGDGVWQGIAEFMARRFSGRWKRVERVETTGADGGPVEVSQTVTIDVEKLSPMGREVLLAEFKRIKESEQKAIGEGEKDNVDS